MIPEWPAILHYVHTAWPQQSGYTLRTCYIVSNQRQMGYKVGVCVGLGGYANAGDGVHGEEPRAEYDGLPYFRYVPMLFPRTRLYSTIRSLSEKSVRGIGRLRQRIDIPVYADWMGGNWAVPDILHAHSPGRTGLEGWRMARRLKAAFVYEVRGFWALSHAADYGERIDVDDAVAGDVRVAQKADGVVALCQGIADVLVRNGVSSSRISIIPNGVDARAFTPSKYDEEHATQLGLNGRFVFGYATNVRWLEGIQDVVRAWPLIKKAVPEAAFLLVGDGRYMETLRQLVHDCGVQDDWRMVGRVPHSQMKTYYSLLDVFVVPRVSERVCEIVTPLKPLEAMAMGIPVVASNVSALREMLEDGKTGLLFDAGSPESLAAACIRMATDRSLRTAIQRSASDWVRKERDWRIVASRYASVYEPLISR